MARISMQPGVLENRYLETKNIGDPNNFEVFLQGFRTLTDLNL